MAPSEHISFWWSHFPCGVGRDAGSIFAYWADDACDLRLLWRLLQPGMTFFDIGANHGIYTITAAKRLGDSGSVVAFEPSPREQRRLKLHLRLNGITSVRVVPYALAADEGEAVLVTIISGNTGKNSLRSLLTDEPVKPVAIQKTTIDKYLARTATKAVDLVKVDTEGAELEIFRGAHRLLGDLRPLVLCEVLDQSTRPWGYPAREIVTRLQAYDYQWFDIRPDGSLVGHRVRDEYPEVRNYLAVPREKKHYIQ